jgi:hypothetical protein
VIDSRVRGEAIRDHRADSMGIESVQALPHPVGWVDVGWRIEDGLSGFLRQHRRL